MKNQCDICGQDAVTKGALKMHQTIKHPMNDLQKPVEDQALVEKLSPVVQQIRQREREIQSVQDEATRLISQAIDKNVPVEALERLLTMRRELRAEKAKEEYDRAMAEFQAECPIIERKKQGYNYKYAPIEVIAEQIKSSLSKHGFSYTFDTDEAENGVIVFCKVKHTAGHMETTKVRITKEVTTKMNASQQSGAAMTYGKRYALMNAFGIHVQDEDNDAEDIAANPQNASPTPLKSPQNANYGNDYKITYKQILFIKGLLDRKGFKLSQLFIKYDVHSMEELSGNQASTIIEKLKGLPDNPNSKLPQTEPEQLPIESGEITPEEMDRIDRAIDPASAPTEKSE